MKKKKAVASKKPRTAKKQPSPTVKRPRASTASRAAAGGGALRTLYPPIEPLRLGYLRVSDVHELYFEESGNPAGKPAVFLHGGPGAGGDRRARRFFDPRHYRIVNFDQRG